MRAAVVALTLLGASSPALAGYGGGGLTTQVLELDAEELGGATLGEMRCWGAQGYGVTRDGPMRLGGDGTTCRGPTASMHTGGFQIGWHSQSRPLYVSVYASVGGGFIQTHDRRRSWHSAIAYSRPTATLGLPLGPMSAEVSAFLGVPLPVVQWVRGQGPVDGLVYGGVEFSVMFGDFRRPPEPQPQPQTPPTVTVTPAPPPGDRPLALPPAQPIPPPPPQVP